MFYVGSEIKGSSLLFHILSPKVISIANNLKTSRYKRVSDLLTVGTSTPANHQSSESVKTMLF